MANLKNKDSNRIKSLLLKIKELAERGEKGERENAKLKLNELMSKYGISNFDVNKKYKKHSFKLFDFDDCKVIMTHCILDTNTNNIIEGDKRKKELYCDLTDEQYIDVCEKFNHYYPDYHSQKENFLKAFIIKNELGIEDTIDSEEDSDSILEILNKTKIINRNKYEKVQVK